MPKRSRTTAFTPGPYVNKPYKRPRRTGPKSTVYKRKYGVQRTMGGQITADNHYFDAQGATASVVINASTTGWSLTRVETYKSADGTTPIGCLFAPQEGNDIQNRYGQKVFLKNIRLQGVVRMVKQATQNAADNGCRIRVILVEDCQTNGTSLTGDLVMGSGFAGLPNYMFQNTANFGRFKVLKDKAFVIGNAAMANDTGATGGIVQSGQEREFKWNIKINDWVKFNNTDGGTVADIVDKSYHILAHTDNSDYAPTIAYKSRCTFTP